MRRSTSSVASIMLQSTSGLCATPPEALGTCVFLSSHEFINPVYTFSPLLFPLKLDAHEASSGTVSESLNLSCCLFMEGSGV